MDNPAETTRQKIIRAAFELFLEKGFHATSMRQIASRCGLAVAGIYNHFGNKEDLFETVLLAYHPFVNTFPVLARAQGDSVEEYLRDAARRLVAELGTEQQFLRLMFIEVVEFDNRHAAVLLKQALPLLQQFLQGLYQRRDALRAYPPIVILRSFLGLFFSYFLSETMIAPYLPGEYSADVFDSFVDIFLHGILISTEENACPSPA
jgi:TetR/AcrR family transcriptional regulator, mexJK operon transcriptional repressor